MTTQSDFMKKSQYTSVSSKTDNALFSHKSFCGAWNTDFMASDIYLQLVKKSYNLNSYFL